MPQSRANLTLVQPGAPLPEPPPKPERSIFLTSLPNMITIARLFLVPVVITMIATHEWKWAFLTFVVAGVSDAIDGWLAKTFDLRSELGAYLDPIADKALLVSIYIALSTIAVVHPAVTVLVVSRDIMIMGAILLSWMLHQPVEINPLLISKLNTTAQISFAALILGSRAFGMDLGIAFEIGLFSVVALTMASALAYLGQWVRHMGFWTR